MKRIFLELIDYKIHAIHTTWWNQIMMLYLKAGEPFEIRCWREEKDIVESILPFGSISKERSTDYEVSVTGILTDQMMQTILQQPKPEDEEQMTPFFTMNIGGCFCSAHYGKELYIDQPTDAVLWQVNEIIAPIREYFNYDEYEISGN